MADEVFVGKLACFNDFCNNNIIIVFLVFAC